MTLTALLLVNPHARQTGGKGEHLAQLLAERGIKVIEPASDDSASFADVSAVIRQHQGAITLVVIAGGDGTINAALPALVETKLPLAIVALGTANDLARTLAIPPDVAAALDLILNGEIQQIDVGRVNDRHFVNVAGIGLGVKITRRLSKQSKAFWGLLAYLRTALQVAWSARRFSVAITAAGQTIELKAMHIAVGNGRHYGGGMTVSDIAEIDDGLLDLYALEVRRWWQILGLLPALRSGTLSGAKHVSTVRSATIEIQTRRPLRVSTDGEMATRTPAQFTIARRALAVYVPRKV